MKNTTETLILNHLVDMKAQASKRKKGTPSAEGLTAEQVGEALYHKHIGGGGDPSAWAGPVLRRLAKRGTIHCTAPQRGKATTFWA